MKKAKLFIVMFLIAIIMGTGASLLVVEDAQACMCEGLYWVVLSCDTGPNCTNPSYPYYTYKENYSCGHCYIWIGCNNGVKAGC